MALNRPAPVPHISMSPQNEQLPSTYCNVVILHLNHYCNHTLHNPRKKPNTESSSTFALGAGGKSGKPFLNATIVKSQATPVGIV